MGHKIDSLQKKLQMLEMLPSMLATDIEISEVRSALNVRLDAENTMWRQCSRNFLAHGGGSKHKFFPYKGYQPQTVKHHSWPM